MASSEESVPQATESRVNAVNKIIMAMPNFSTVDILRSLDEFCKHCHEVFPLEKKPLPFALRSLYVTSIIGKASQEGKTSAEENITIMHSAQLAEMQKKENASRNLPVGTHNIDLQHILADLTERNSQIKSLTTELEAVKTEQQSLNNTLLEKIEDARKKLTPKPLDEKRFLLAARLIAQELSLRDQIDDPNTPRETRLKQEKILAEIRKKIEHLLPQDSVKPAVNELIDALKTHRITSGKNAHKAKDIAAKIKQTHSAQQQGLADKVKAAQKELHRIRASTQLESSAKGPTLEQA